MAYKDKVVDVVVSLGTSPIDQLGFDTPLFVTPTNVFTTRVQSYSDLDSIVSAGFAVGSPVHRFAENCFAGKFRPDVVKVGRLAYTGTTVTYNQASYSGVLTLNITVKTNTSSFVKVISTASLSAASTPTQAATAVAVALEADMVKLFPAVFDVVTLSIPIVLAAPPSKDKLDVGLVVPIPMLPPLVIRILSDKSGESIVPLFVLNIKDALVPEPPASSFQEPDFNI